MRHRKKSQRFSRPRAQKKALVKALLRAIIINERIITVTSKAKYISAEIDRLITKAKKDNLASRRLVYRKLGDHLLVKRLFEVIGPRFKSINGGYSRIVRLMPRKGDGAAMAIVELTKREIKVKTHKDKKVKPARATTEEVESGKIEASKKEEKKKSLISGVKKIFKKERDKIK